MFQAPYAMLNLTPDEIIEKVKNPTPQTRSVSVSYLFSQLTRLYMTAKFFGAPTWPAPRTIYPHLFPMLCP